MRKKRRPVCLALGFFDGVHKGHRKVIDAAVRCARRTGGEAWVMTFDSHPMKVLSPVKAPLLLTCNRHKLSILGGMDIDGCVLEPFNRKLAGRSPEEFVKKLVRDIPSLSRIFIGKNWRFGKNQSGDAVLMSRLGKKMGFSVTVVSPVKRKGKIISSTRIRREILAGNLKEAEAQTGHPFSIMGRVVKGRGIGRRIGFPTANLRTENEVIPPRGVYAVRAGFPGKKKLFDGVLNIGYRPTFSSKCREKKSLSIELHMIGVKTMVYQKTIEVFFIRKIRGEKKFSSVEKLAERIALDLKTVQK